MVRFRTRPPSHRSIAPAGAPEELPLVEKPKDAFRLLQQVLSGQLRWRQKRAKVLAYDPEETQYGLQPPDLDEYFRDTIRLAMDPESDQPTTKFPFSAVRSLVEALKAGDPAT